MSLINPGLTIGNITSYDTTQHSSANTLYKHGLISPVKLNATLTYLYGKDSDMMAPLLMLTEGNGAMARLSRTEMNDSQFMWDVVGRETHTMKCLGLVNTSNTKPGYGGSTFEMYFDSALGHKYFSIYTPNKENYVRIEAEPTKVAANKYKYLVTFITSSKTAYLAASQLVSGNYWVLGAPTIPLERSSGTASNRLVPGKMKNQWGAHRFSMNIAGNISNKVTNINFPLDNGGTTKLWLPWEMDQWERTRRLQKEHWLWFSEYNRSTSGEIMTVDHDTGEPVPQTAGLRQQIYATGNYSTYSTLTISKLNNTVHSVFSNRVDNTPMEIVLYTGTGGAIAFDEAIKSDARGYQYYTPLGEKEIMDGKENYLSYGRYFRQYKTVNGHILTVKVVPFFDLGLFAELDRANGNLVGAFPVDSYTMVFVDHSRTDDGGRNVTLTTEMGREHISKVYAGMSPLPPAWQAMGADKFLSTKGDEASYEVIDTAGLAIKNATTSFWLQYEQ